MWKNSFHQQQLTGIRQRIDTFQREHDSLARKFLDTKAKKDRETDQLSEGQRQVASLEDNHAENLVLCQEKQKKIHQRHLKIQELKNEVDDITIQTRQVKQEAAEKKEEAYLIEKELNRLKPNKLELQKKILDQNTIISSAAPAPQYKIDGEYCENGIYHCTNHPPRRVLTNGYKIEEHERNIQQARNTKAALEKELAELDKKINTSQARYAEVNKLIAETETTYQRLEGKLAAKQNDLEKAQHDCEQEEIDYEALLEKSALFKKHLDTTRQSLENIKKQLFSTELDMSTIQDQITDTIHQIQILEEQARQINTARLEEIARQELLEEQARQELEQEQLTQAQDYGTTEETGLTDQATERNEDNSFNPKSFFGSTAEHLQQKADRMEQAMQETVDETTQMGKQAFRQALRGANGGIEKIKKFSQFSRGHLSDLVDSTFQDADTLTEDAKQHRGFSQ